MVFDTVSLDAIVQEARACFLYEDAPDYLTILEQGIQRLLLPPAEPNSGEYVAMMRATHSIKGGAGIAQLTSLSQLAHKLEDLLQALHEQRIPPPIRDTAYELLALGVEQVKDLVTVATSDPAIPSDTPIPLIEGINCLLQELPPQTATLDSTLEDDRANAINPYILKTALEVDLEECLQRVETLLKPPVRSPALKQGLVSLIEECTLLGQALNLSWLVDTADRVSKALTQTNPPLEQIAKSAIAQMRKLRMQAIEEGKSQKSEAKSQENTTGAERESQSNHQLPTTNYQLPITNLNLRVPVTRLDRMNNSLGELLISYERLSLYQSHLYQASAALKKQTQQLNPINEQVRIFYDQLATPLAASAGKLKTAKGEFDPLQFDRYTAFHSTLQNFQELMVRVQEIRSDIDLVARDFHEGLDQIRQQLYSLREDVTQSRLVPFRFLAERFVAPLQTLSQRYGKAVELAIAGKDTPIDQVILEQLQTPLTHLLRNAFDHGIEPTETRLTQGKPRVAQIILSTEVKENQVTIAIADDGRGIDLAKVQQRAVQLNLCPAAAKLKPKQVLEFLFVPGFSTAAAVTDLSGRGIGLDVVRQQVERLRGTVEIETAWQQGTKFTITIPLTLSVLPLLVCRCQQRLLAIPSTEVREIIALAEFCDPASPSEAIVWQNRSARLFLLTQLLPFRQVPVAPEPLHQKLGIVLQVRGEPVVVAVDALLGEKELVLKPFDDAVKVPNYIAGCTVLGTGEVVLVLSPHRFEELIDRTQPSSIPQDNRDSASREVPKILLVDDSVGVRRMLDRLLVQSGYQVVQCRDGKEALEALNRAGDRYDLVISDLEMPHLDGFSLLREIRTHPRWRSLAFAMLTSRDNDRHRLKANQLGATAYFTKPFQPHELLKAIAALLTDAAKET